MHQSQVSVWLKTGELHHCRPTLARRTYPGQQQPAAPQRAAVPHHGHKDEEAAPGNDDGMDCWGIHQDGRFLQPATRVQVVVRYVSAWGGGSPSHASEAGLTWCGLSGSGWCSGSLWSRLPLPAHMLPSAGHKHTDQVLLPTNNISESPACQTVSPRTCSRSWTSS